MEPIFERFENGALLHPIFIAFPLPSGSILYNNLSETKGKAGNT